MSMMRHTYATRRMRDRERGADETGEEEEEEEGRRERDARRQTDGSKLDTRRYGDLDRSPSIILILILKKAFEVYSHFV